MDNRSPVAYNVYRATASSAEASPPAYTYTGITGTTYTDTAVTPGVTYYYKVTSYWAEVGGGESGQSSQVYATPVVYPQPATNLAAVAASNSVALTWTAGANASTYTVYRSTTATGLTNSGTNSGDVIASGLTATTYTDTGAVNGTVYVYTILAENANGPAQNDSGTVEYSNLVTAMPLVGVPAAPPDLTATPGNATVYLTWQTPAASTTYGAPGYYILTRSGASSATVKLLAGPAGTQNYEDTGLTNGSTYNYSVAAVNASGTGTASNSASAVPSSDLINVPVITATASEPTTGTPILNGGYYNGTLTVSMADSTSGATIRYTTSTTGTAPAAPTSSSTAYSSPVTFTSNEIIAAAAFTTAGASASTTYSYSLEVPPTVSLTAPADNAAFTPGSDVTLTASAVGNNGASLVEVIFYAGADQVGVATEPSGTNTYTVTWNDVPQPSGNTYSLTAVAVDCFGGTTTSSPISITVMPQVVTTPITCGQTLSGNLTYDSGLESNAAREFVPCWEKDVQGTGPQKISWPGAQLIALDEHATPQSSPGEVPDLVLTPNAEIGHLADHYTFQPDAGATYVISERSQAFDAYLNLYDPDGNLVAFNDDSQNATPDSQIVYAMPSTLPGSGVYTIECTTYAPNQIGAYTVSLTSDTTDCDSGTLTPTLAVYQPNSDGTPTLLASGSTITFAEIAEGASEGQTVTLTNTGLVDIALQNPTSSGAGAAYFGMTTPLPAILEAGQSVQVTLDYDDAAHAETDTDTFTFNGENTPVSYSGDNPPTPSNGTATDLTYALDLAGTTSSDIAPPTPLITTFAINPVSVLGGGPATGTVTLNMAAPSGGETVYLSSGAPGIAAPVNGSGSTITSFTVAAGQTTGTFSIATVAPTDSTETSVQLGVATMNGSTYTSTAFADIAVFPTNAVPVVSIKSPSNDSTIGTGTTTVTAQADPASANSEWSNYTIARVDFTATPSGGSAAPIGEVTVPNAGTTDQFTTTWNPAVGTYTLTAIATANNGLTATATSTVTVSDQPVTPSPSISATNNTGAALSAGGTTTGFGVVTLGDSNSGVSIYYTTDGSAPSPSNGTRYTTPFPITPADGVIPSGGGNPVVTVHAAAFLAGDLPSSEVTTAYVIATTGTASAPVAQITSPGDGAEAMGQVPIVGAAVGGNLDGASAFASWRLDYASMSANAPSTYTTFATGYSQVGTLNTSGAVATTGTIATMDTSLMLDGQYDIRLTVFDTDGQSVAWDNYVVIKGHQKVGYFTLSYTDMTIPIAGFPISVIRTYDSRNKTGGDFGIGWTLSTTNVTFAKPEVSGWDWDQDSSTFGGFTTYYMQPVRAHNITITLPGDMVYSFVEGMSPNQQFEAPLKSSTMTYTQLSGPVATLTPCDDTGTPLDMNVYIQSPQGGTGGVGQDPNQDPNAVELYESDLETPYEPAEFMMTLHNGTSYLMDTSGNLLSVTDLNGNTVKFSAGSISNSSGRAITITRGSTYITGITDMMGNTYQYSQSGTGDLASSTDRTGNTTTYSYDMNHNLTGIKNPLGQTPVENYYYPDGRLDYTLEAALPNGTVPQINYYYNSTLEPGGAQPTSGPITTVPANGQVTTDALGNPTLSIYDSYGNVTEKAQWLTDATHTNTPVTTTSVFGDPNNPGLPTRVTDPMGNNTDYTYDAAGDTLTKTKYLTNADGSVTPVTSASTYNAYGQALTLTDAMGVVTATNRYDANGNLTSAKDAIGNVTTCVPNSDGSIGVIIDPLGNTYRGQYDHNIPPGNLTQVAEANGHATEFGYDADGNRTSITTTMTGSTGTIETLTTRVIYDASNRVVESIAADGSSSCTMYNALGQIDHITDALGNSTFYQYDGEGRLVEVTFPDGTMNSTQYDLDGRVYITTDASGRGMKRTYDTLGRVYENIPLDQSGNPLPDDNGGIVCSYTTFDLDGREIGATDPNGNVSNTRLDSLGREITDTDALGDVTITGYDLDGRAVYLTDANGHTTNTSYDAAGHIISVVYPDGASTSTAYDALGRATTQTDQLGEITMFGYDARDNLLSVTDPIGNVTRYAYDEVDNRISQTDAAGHMTSMAYDVMGRLIQRALPVVPTGYTNPSAQFETRTYDVLGRLQTTTDNNGVVTTYQYDPITERLLTESASTGDWVGYDYYSDGSLHDAYRGDLSVTESTTTYTYEAATGRLHSVAGPNGTITYHYDSASNKIEVDAPSATTYVSYDADNRISCVTHFGNVPVAAYTYDAVGNRISLTRGNGIVTNYVYDSLNRLTGLNNSTGPSFHYILDPDGRRISVTEAGNMTPGTTNYSYDADGRLLTEVETPSNGGASLVNNNYYYDAVGNRIEKVISGNETVSHFDANDRITDSGYSFDADGNQTTVDGQTAAYDFENHLVQLGPTNSPTALYTYDGTGNRLSVTTSSGETNFLVDTSTPYATVAEEHDVNGNLISRFDYADDLISMTTGANTWFYVGDGLGNTRALSNGSGAVTDTWVYDAFGNTVTHSGTTLNEFLYNGQQLDAATSDYYLRARYYSQQDGRFLSTDPYGGDIVDPITLHRYVYAGQDPTNMSDPGGMDFDIAMNVLNDFVGIVPIQFLGQNPNEIYLVHGSNGNPDDFSEAFKSVLSFETGVSLSQIFSYSWANVTGKSSTDSHQVQRAGDEFGALMREEKEQNHIVDVYGYSNGGNVATWGAIQQGAGGSPHVVVRLGTPVWDDAGPSSVEGLPTMFFNVYDPDDGVVFGLSGLQHGSRRLPHGTTNWLNVRVDAPHPRHWGAWSKEKTELDKHTEGMRSVKVLRQFFDKVPQEVR